MRKFTDIILDQANGRPVSGATVTVRVANASPGSGALATIYSDAGNSVITGSAVTTDALGRFTFYAADNRYDFTITGTGITTQTTGDLGAGGVVVPGAVSVMDFGAVADGVTDDSAAFTKAAASSSYIIVPQGSYVKNTQTNISSGQTWRFEGATVSQTDNTKTLFAATNVNDWAIEGVGTFVGSNSGSNTAEILLSVSDGLRFRVNNLTCKNSSGWGFKHASANAPALRGEGGQYVNCIGLSNYKGNEVTAGSGAEYSTWTNFQAIGNVNAGVIVGAGNTTFIGGSISDNTGDGVVLTSGSNHGHGSFSNVNINHNGGYNVNSNACTLGFTFTGCHFYANSAGTGQIYLNASKGVSFVGCMIDSNILNDNPAGNNSFLGNYFVSNTATAAPAGISGSTNLVLSGNTIPTGNGGWAYNNALDVGNGTISAGTRATGLSIGDISASRSATTGAIFPGSDGNKYLFRSTDQLQFGGFTSLAPASSALSSLGTASLPFSGAFANQIITPRLDVTLANGANSDIAISSRSFVRIVGPTGVFSISGFAGGVDGAELRIFNSVAFAMTITNNATSTAANRITTLTGADVTLRAGTSAATFIYDGGTSRWILMSTN